jgi:hypothetical protein
VKEELLTPEKYMNKDIYGGKYGEKRYGKEERKNIK